MNFSPVHYIAIPLLAAFIIPLASKLSKELARIIPGIVFLYLSIVSTILLPQALENPIVEVIAGWKAPLGINLVYGPFAAFMTAMITMLGFVIWIYSYRFIRREPADKFYMLFMLLITGSVGIFLTGDIFNLFVFLEIVAISAYSLTAFLRDKDGAEAGFKYLLIGSFASTFVLLAIVILYSQVGTLNMAEISLLMPTVPFHIKIIILAFFIAGLGIEAELFPLNGWAPDAYSQAPTPVGAVFAGIVVKSGVYALIMVVHVLFDIKSAFDLLIILGIITLLIAEMSAMRQKQIKRMLAFSSIGQMGLIIIAFSLGTVDGMFGGIFHMFNHAIIKSMLFFAAGYLVYNSNKKEVTDFDGLGKKMPFTAFIFSMGALAIIGLPPFSGFWSKFSILTATAETGHYAIIALVLIGGIIEAVYYLRIVGKLYFKDYKDDFVVSRASISGVISMGILALIIIVVGVYPNIITDYVTAAANDLFDKAAYVKASLSSLN